MKYKIPITQVISFAAFAVLLVFAACKKEYDTPPERILPVGSVLTIEELRNLYQGEPVRFDTAKSVYAVVTADESSGNLYRNIHVQDHTGAIVLRLNTPGGIYEGDSIRLYLPGTILSQYQGMMQLDSVDVDNNIIKQATQVHVAPLEINSLDEITPAIQGYLVKVNGVEFVENQLGQTYADAISQSTQNRTLVDCDGNSVLVRTSGYANFANQVIPSGNGSLIAVVSQFNTDMQLYIRRTSEIVMDSLRCDGSTGENLNYLFKDFEDQSITSGGWSNYQVLSSPGNHNWQTSNQGPDDFYYAIASGYNNQTSTTSQTELWLISPSVNLTDAVAPGLTFKNAKNYQGPALQLMFSTDYDGTSSPNEQGNWQNFSGLAMWSIGSFTWVNSGIIQLTNYVNEPNFRIAFKYTSTTQAASWEVNDIQIKEY